MNAISNLAFWLAAWLVWRSWQRARPMPVLPTTSSGSADIKSLLVMLLLIGAGSFAFQQAKRYIISSCSHTYLLV